MSLTEFLHMGGYAFYVWGAYSLGFVVLLGNLVYAVIQHRQIRKEIVRRANRSGSAG